MEKSSILIWDYWINNKLMMAYCIGEKEGKLYFSSAPYQQLEGYENNMEGEEWKNR